MIQYQSKGERSAQTEGCVTSFRNFLNVNRWSLSDAVLLLGMVCDDTKIDLIKLIDKLKKSNTDEEIKTAIIKSPMVGREFRIVSQGKDVPNLLGSAIQSALDDFMEQMGVDSATLLVGDPSKDYKALLGSATGNRPESVCSECERFKQEVAQLNREAAQRSIELLEARRRCSIVEDHVPSVCHDFVIEEFVPYRHRSDKHYRCMKVVRDFLLKSALTIYECRILLDMISDERDHDLLEGD